MMVLFLVIGYAVVGVVVGLVVGIDAARNDPPSDLPPPSDADLGASTFVVMVVWPFYALVGLLWLSMRLLGAAVRRMASGDRR